MSRELRSQNVSPTKKMKLGHEKAQELKDLSESGINYDIPKLMSNARYLPNVKQFKWSEEAFIRYVNDQNGKGLSFTMFGRLTNCKCSVYGDLNEVYHDSLTEKGIKSFVFSLKPSRDYGDEFSKCVAKITEIEDAVDPTFKVSGFRSVISPMELRFKRKIAIKATGSELYIPDDLEGIIDMY
ncbi:hypothetical protein HDV02_003000 [Globomyces sp. JEL0801]|nr:hypothetical protein HDV02_003000 [Globomyces sp. JEL0801]